mgnify:CR=1 FL=1
MHILIKIITILFLATEVLSQSPISISFGPVKLGEKRIDIDLANFKIEKEHKSDLVKTRIIKNSTQWIRTADNLLTPRALVSISVKSKQTVSLLHQGKSIILQGSDIKNTKLYLNIFNPGDIKVFLGKNNIESLRLSSKTIVKNKKGHLIDYTCSSYSIEIEGLDDQYLSLGCNMERVGKIGKERSRLILSWSTTNYKLLSTQGSPYTSVLMNNQPITFNMVNSKGDTRSVKISAKFSKRFNRLKMAVGLGPYSLKTKDGARISSTKIAPAFMLYGKWDLTSASSLRGFNAFVANKSYFNNAGLYFAYDLATALDNRFKLVPLLGAQVLTFKYDSNSKTSNKIIYPQGFEATYKHIFGIKNYHMTYGMFLSTQTDEKYDNIWLRWGRGYFWELNYIRWGRDNRDATTMGISIGIPIGKYF